MRPNISSVLALVWLSASAHAFSSNASLDSGDIDSRSLNTILVARSNLLSSMTSLKRALFGRNTAIEARASCPEIWYTVAADFRREFDGCSRRASSAIRFAFHDAGGYSSQNTPYLPASGGADGSLLLSDVEIARSDHDPMQGFREYMINKWNLYKAQGVGAADFVQLAGNLGVYSCSGGPIVKTLVGREDSSEPSPEGTLPHAFGAGADHDSLVKLFAQKGITPRELAALMGAHTVSRSFAQKNNSMEYAIPQDSSPQVWDHQYFSQTQTATTGVGSFESDKNLANPVTIVGESYTEFANDREAWVLAFQESMLKLSLLGLSEEKIAGLIDCTDVLTG